MLKCQGNGATLEACAALPKQDVIRVPSSGCRVLYVKEGELAMNVDMEAFDFLGTDDATTCHVLLVRSRSTNRVSVAHLNSPECCDGLGEVLSKLAAYGVPSVEDAEGGGLDVHVLGGLLHDPLSLDILQGLLEEMHTSSAQCYLQTLCVQRFNHSSLPLTAKYSGNDDHEEFVFPALYGLGYCRLGGPGVFGDLERPLVACPMSFPLAVRGPGSLLRRCAVFQPTVSTGLGVVFDGSEAARFKIHYRPCHADPDTIEYMMSMGEEEFLETASTSPHCEPAHFGAEIREVLEFCLDPGALDRSFGGKAVLEYEMSASGEWVGV